MTDQPRQRNAFEVAHEALLARYGALEPERIRALGGDDVEVGAAKNIALYLGEQPSITCPRCGRTSWNPMDVQERYCGACHWWTSDSI